MAVIEWMPRGRKSEAGVPYALGWDRTKANRHERLMFARKMGERKQKAKEIELLKPHELSPYQKCAGARLIA